MGIFRYTRMPFGLSFASSCFQKIMATIFAGILGVVVYLDDIVVHGEIVTTHDDHLSRVLNVLAHHNLPLNRDKCIFAVPVIEFVGFRLTTSAHFTQMSMPSCACLSPPALHSYRHIWE
ncbi:hypothetical protein JOB18_029265 [Solea senegalensis]|uniref:Reverse transcriptase domain-containing protein n=1 Tax=Solea senegalensis TaxID=28829 RepID=A0AAV6Q0Z6_SOLSE|nr:hypothetical protein JOB18_029265 [Solea senegalensis]